MASSLTGLALRTRTLRDEDEEEVGNKDGVVIKSNIYKKLKNSRQGKSKI